MILPLHQGQHLQEQQLAADCAKGQPRAQRQLYDTYAPQMYAICSRYIKDTHEAEDVLITAFGTILNKITQYQGTGSLENWMRRIVINKCLASLRRHKLQEVDAQQTQIATHATAQPEADDLIKLINQLPTGQATVFNLYAIDGYSHKEIATMLGISQQTSKSQLSRARQYLQNCLKPNHTAQTTA